MADFWSDELSEERTVELLNGMADKVRKRKMEMPAILALEMHKPIAGFLSQGSIALAPFLIPIFGFDNVNDTSRVMARPENVERLITMLENPPEALPQEVA